MTEKTFLILLSKTKDMFKWLLKGDSVRAKRKRNNQHTKDKCMCPIEAVYLAKYGHHKYYTEAGDILGLKPELVDTIINGSDLYGCVLTNKIRKAVGL